LTKLLEKVWGLGLFGTGTRYLFNSVSGHDIDRDATCANVSTISRTAYSSQMRPPIIENKMGNNTTVCFLTAILQVE